MKLYNTLTRKTEELAPLNPPEVTVYTCGPTVYDYAHIGHWFTYIRWDLLIRTLQASGLKPKWVMNITDVGHLVSDADEGEDKLEKGARREGKTAWEVAEFYTKDFLDEMHSLHIQDPTFLTKATDHIAEQIELIQKLEAKGFTYVIDDGVYYDTSKFPAYGDFAKLDLEEQQAGARVEYNQQKRNPTDFALWKFSPHDQKRDMEWDSPWGKGFPGWHIECSAMSMKYLGDTLDIHTGGIDHIPVHHTNEIAQSEAATGKRFANMWLHSNHVLIEGEKISKSLGNGIRLKDITEKGISLEAFRLHVLESHYRSQSKFSWESLEAAQNRLHEYQEVADLKYQPSSKAATLAVIGAGTFDNTLRYLQDDLRTPEALAKLSERMAIIKANPPAADQFAVFQHYLEQLDALLGLSLSARPDITKEQYDLLHNRETARTSKDWAKSDQLRDQLAEQGVGLRDTPNGAVWYRL
ncbi:MAG TPA: cysteine--tRNA ligase [Candidatus Saccharimonadales bacterium]|nr:cysteine--tRNA ligase [Candidatus Saccharimonadales bacterium]